MMERIGRGNEEPAGPAAAGSAGLTSRIDHFPAEKVTSSWLPLLISMLNSGFSAIP
jgi:hypothetical protein